MEQKENVNSIIELNLKKIGWIGFILTIVLSIIGLNLYVALYNGINITFSLFDLLLVLVGYAVLVVLHECFHLAGFWFFGKVPWSSMDYGVNLKLGIAYATTTIPIPNQAMKKALLLPFWMTGVVPVIIGYIIESPILVLLGAWLIAGAVGDFAMYKELRKHPMDALIQDDPVNPKLYVLRKTV